jgi:uncharacterized OsmC-like protein
MSKQRRIAAALERLSAALKARPSAGQVTGTTVCELRDGLKGHCDASGFNFHVDLDERMGGEGSAPSPGAYARGAVASCLAMNCAMVFAQRDLPFSSIRVQVVADLDAGSGVLALNDDPPGFRALRYLVDVESTADAATIWDATEAACSRSTMLATIARPVPVSGRIRVNEAGVPAG